MYKSQILEGLNYLKMKKRVKRFVRFLLGSQESRLPTYKLKPYDILLSTKLSSLVSGSAMPQISTNEVKQLKIPSLSKEQQKKVIASFQKEIDTYKKIDELQSKANLIHKEFLGDISE